MKGISIIKQDRYIVCYVEEFSDELKDLVREDLRHICHGKNEVEVYGLDSHSYKKTLVEFLKRYDGKSPNTKKGMMGELIAHLIINKVLPELKTITILFNKEDLSIKKGFDLTYVEIDKGVIWYGEVKSGELHDTDTPDSKNKKLLSNSKKGMEGFLSGERPHLWNSVITDVGLSIALNEHRTVKDLLDQDIKQIEAGIVKKNAILISVLFHTMENKISPNSLQVHLAEIIADNAFSNVILFSIQKSTYTKIESFLKKEVENQ